MTVEQYIEWLEQERSIVKEKLTEFMDNMTQEGYDQFPKWISRLTTLEECLEKAEEISRDQATERIGQSDG